jgi:predicted Zn-dependent protease
MDLTTIALVALLTFGLLGTDAVVNAGSVEVEVTIAPRIENVSIDKEALTAEFENQLEAINSTASLFPPFEARARREQGIGMALAEAINVRNVAYSLRYQLGYRPDYIRLALFSEDGGVRGLVSGYSHLLGNFSSAISRNPGEPLMALVQRCAFWGDTQLAPYSSALYLLDKHRSDDELSGVVKLVENARALLPPTPTSFDRSLFDNLLGLVALFRQDIRSARATFDAAIKADPSNPVPVLNAAFTDLQFDDYRKAIDRLERLMITAPPTDMVLRGTAYMTWGAALMGLRDLTAANGMLSLAHQTNPSSSSTLSLWGEEMLLEGNPAAAEQLETQAMHETAAFENYGELAALYFHHAWMGGQQVARSKFTNPAVVHLH